MPTDQTTAPRSASGSAASHASGSKFGVTVADEAAFSMDKVVPFKHNFDQHPLMQLDELEKLANRLLPTKQCRFIKPGATFAQGFHHDDKPDDGRDLREVFARIHEPKSWIALYNVETDPLYAGMIEEAIGSARHLIDREQPGTYLKNGFIFISAPPSVTPFHIDREHNFWMQIRGRKTMNVWNPDDRTMVSQADVERFITFRTLENVKLRDESLTSRSLEMDCGPGDGVYFPSTSPHATRCDSAWTKPGEGVAISIGINFYTPAMRRHANLHALNEMLRKVGMNPSFPGKSEALDSVKLPLAKAYVAMQKMRGFEPPPGF
jgi:hypothetical protein